jgi:hypothetical protein
MLWRSSVKNFQLALGTVLYRASPAALDDVIDAVSSNPGESGSSPGSRP